MQCPKCNSDDIQRLQVIYEHGTQNINTKSISKGSSGIIGKHTTTKTSTSGTSQSIMAQKSAPPIKYTPLFTFLFFGILSILFLLLAAVWWGFSIIGVLFIVVCIYDTKRAMENNKSWPARYEAWQKTWVCHKCGTFFEET